MATAKIKWSNAASSSLSYKVAGKAGTSTLSADSVSSVVDTVPDDNVSRKLPKVGFSPSTNEEFAIVIQNIGQGGVTVTVTNPNGTTATGSNLLNNGVVTLSLFSDTDGGLIVGTIDITPVIPPHAGA